MPRNEELSLPVDLSKVTVTLAGRPLPLTDFPSKEPKRDRATGYQLYEYRAVLATPTDAGVIKVKIPGDPPAGLVSGAQVVMAGLTGRAYFMEREVDGKRRVQWGVSYRADSVAPVAVAKVADR